MKHLHDTWPVVRAKFIEDLKWWRIKLNFWKEGGSGCCYPVLNKSTLDRPGAISLLVSDWSGPDGFGGLSGDLHDPDPRVFSNRHPELHVKDSSFVGELKVLLHDLKHDLELAASSHPSGNASPPPLPPILKLFVTDNEAAAFALNKGTCFDDIGNAVLEEIFELANTLRLPLLAVFLPREYNTIADDLSHFAHLMNVTKFEGRFSDLPAHITMGPGSFAWRTSSCQATASFQD
jgi:hypothetical protein